MATSQVTHTDAADTPVIIGDRTADGRMAVSVEEFGRLCGGLSRSSSYNAVRLGLVKSTRIGGRIVIAVREINRILDSGDHA